MNKVIRDGKVAVLISPGYGAGWSTWFNGKLEQLSLHDPRIVQFMIDNFLCDNKFNDVSVKTSEDGDKLKKFVSSLPEYAKIHLGGLETLEIRWVLEDAEFYIDEFDGYETLHYGNRNPF